MTTATAPSPKKKRTSTSANAADALEALERRIAEVRLRIATIPRELSTAEKDFDDALRAGRQRQAEACQTHIGELQSEAERLRRECGLLEQTDLPELRRSVAQARLPAELDHVRGLIAAFMREQDAAIDAFIASVDRLRKLRDHYRQVDAALDAVRSTGAAAGQPVMLSEDFSYLPGDARSRIINTTGPVRGVCSY